MNTMINFPSRISARAIVAAITLSFAMIITLMLLIGAFGAWSYRISELQTLSGNFWFWSFFAWAISVGASSYFGSMIGHATTWQDGVLYGVAVWASTCVIGFLFLAGSSDAFLEVPLRMSFMTGAFFGDVLSLAACIWGGVLGSYGEVKLERQEEKAERQRGKFTSGKHIEISI